ncbi:hypothetical protein HaLaN_27536 [Haematococcus lacustris]|uniref:Uncharacterized protein n=1 Tax=Haematococcus lacustris TaxID=44745 RepID=A0A6A0A8R8_HAELA|nr:hypothetical protein HaLaN_27536 [Haematococcus lacustris]
METTRLRYKDMEKRLPGTYTDEVPPMLQPFRTLAEWYWTWRSDKKNVDVGEKQLANVHQGLMNLVHPFHDVGNSQATYARIVKSRAIKPGYHSPTTASPRLQDTQLQHPQPAAALVRT